MKLYDSFSEIEMMAEKVLAYAIGVMVFVCMITAWRALTDKGPRAARQRLIAARREELRSLAVRPRTSNRREQANFVKIARYLRLAQTTQAEKIRNRLLQAGLRSREAVAIFILAKICLPMVLVATALVLTFSFNFDSIGSFARPFTMFAGALIGFFSPDLFVMNRTAKRRHALRKSLPDGLDLLVICAEAGLSLDAALNRVAAEISHSSSELADELALTAVELSFLPDRRQALANLGTRCGLPAIRGVVNTLIQTEKYGTPLSQSLRVLSAEFREARMLRAEEKAARLPAILTVPMIVFILPALFIVLIGPAMLDVFDHLVK